MSWLPTLSSCAILQAIIETCLLILLFWLGILVFLILTSLQLVLIITQGVALMGRNHTGLPCSVTMELSLDCRQHDVITWPAQVKPPAGQSRSVTDETTTDDDRRQRAKQYWIPCTMCRRPIKIFHIAPWGPEIHMMSVFFWIVKLYKILKYVRLCSRQS